MTTAHKSVPIGVAAASLTAVALAMGVSPGVGVAAPVATGTPATRPAPVDAAMDTLNCSSMTAKVTFSPGLTNSPASGSVSMTMKEVFRGCTAAPPPSGGPPVTIASGQATASLTFPGGSCAGLESGGIVGGTMTFKFKTATGTARLSSGPSLVAFGSFDGGVDAASGALTLGLPGLAAGLPAVQSTGSFSGVDGGRSSALGITDGTFMTDKDRCGARGGLKSLHFGSGSAFLG